MHGKLNILIVSSEMYPYAKVGGLGDVVSSLPATLKKFGHDVRVVIPRYGSIDIEKSAASVRLESMGVWMGNMEEWCAVFETKSPADVPVYMIEHTHYFDREGLYHDNAMNDYDDNPRRFAFFTRAALQLCKDIGFKPDIVHANDWQTALAPAYLKVWHWNDPVLGGAASLLTIHNVAYQGIYSKEHYDYIGLGWQNFNPEALETYGQVNFLKGGIHFADVVTAVSPTFSKEITSAHGGFGLAPYLSNKGENLMGILNGIDYETWDPSKDPNLPAHFSSKNMKGKRDCKAHLQKSFDLNVDENVALIGAIGRFVDQKGFNLIAEAIEGILNDMHVQFVILGSGESGLQEYFGNLPVRYSGRAGSYIGFDAQRAHLIEAGCDFFLMPSLFEPCGLNQMYSMRYGTLPVVRATGGLEDTVLQYNEATGEGTGFKFSEPNAWALYYTVGLAVATYYDRPAHIKKMKKMAMSMDFSWEKSANKYVEAYNKAIAHKRITDKHSRYYW
ncbi:glycogen synthase GlgA [Chitinispirillales bacterium ANBcel5]|uniref:glycogen synthase GlgA n=1 Tax=Cellulosispirillum alkaliphilum TaxID=3039283 RepID=UPI002A56B9B9|nr:glycogen synthase GlgA [Chitinispirillales bacterium ANBcel5]